MLVINCFAPPSANQRAKLAPGQRVVLQTRCLPQLEKLPPKESLFREAAALQKCASDILGSPTAVPKTNHAAHASEYVRTEKHGVGYGDAPKAPPTADDGKARE